MRALGPVIFSLARTAPTPMPPLASGDRGTAVTREIVAPATVSDEHVLYPIVGRHPGTSCRITALERRAPSPWRSR